MAVQVNLEDYAKPWRPGIYPKSTTVIYNNQLWILNDTITGLFSSSNFLAEVANGDWIGRYTTEGDLSTKEDVVNKAIDFTTINDTLYPSVEAVKEQLDSKVDKDTTAGVERVYIINADGSQSTKATSDFGGETFEQSRWQFNDFVTESSNLYPFIGGAVNGGDIFFNLTTGDSILKHKQIIRSGASANGGYRVQTNGNSSNPFLSATGLCFFGIFRIDSRSNARNRIVRIGYHNSINQTAPTNGAFLEITGNDATFKVIDNSVETSSATFTLSSSTGALGYSLLIEWISDTSVKCKLVDTSDNVVFDITHSTNVPASNRRFNCGVVATNTTSGTTVEILQLDYMGFGTAKPNFLNNF